MKVTLIAILFCSFAVVSSAQTKANLITTDLDNFWSAYDKIVAVSNPDEQLAILNREFIDKASTGQQAMFQVRRYAPAEYVDSINKRRSYWDSIRPNTAKAPGLASEIEAGIEKLRAIYPDLKPANIYFTVGVFRSGGTTLDNNVLIGSEIVFADERSMKDIVFTNIHEYVHTQQGRTDLGDLLSQSVMEGIAEFVAVKALNIPSSVPAIAFGRNNEPRVQNAFVTQLLNPYFGYWLYNDAKNEFNTRDLGYYVGYAIAERFYEKATDKKLAIKELIQIDLQDAKAVAAYVDRSGYFAKPVKSLIKAYEKGRPEVVSIREFKTGSKNVSPSVNSLTIVFSREMDRQFRNFQFGSLGEDYGLRIKNFVGLSKDGRTLSLSLEPLLPNRRYQLTIANGFRDANGIALKPYVIDITTAAK